MSKVLLPADQILNLPGTDAEASRESNATASGTEKSRSLPRRWYQAFAAWSGRYSVLAIIFAITLTYLLVLRSAMVLTYADLHKLTFTQGISVFLVGLQYDVLVALCFIIPQLTHFTFTSDRRITGRFNRALLDLTWIIAFLFLPLICIAEYIFFDEFQSRLNYIAFEYIVYPTEVCCNIWQSYPIVELLAVVGLIGGCCWFLLRKNFQNQISSPMPFRRRFGFFAAVLTGIAVLWSSTSAESRQISRDRVANECSWNGLYSFVYYAWTCHFDFNKNYLTLENEEVNQRLREQIVGTGDELKSGSSNPVDRVVATGKPRQDYNVVLILEESLGSDFIGVLGDNRGLTPHFDELSKKGLLFDNFYATGNRTARVLEAVMTSMPPIPTESILKRDHSERVYTLANVLAARGYERLFMTGGRGLFDGVRSFMKANGFNHFIEQSDFKNPLFANAWGVSDEDLFRKALGEIDQLHSKGRPFFATILTVSNHRPYTYPEGRIPNMEQTRNNAVKYADWALGYFFREAQSHEFYQNTLFVVMGDHGARVSGSQLFPMSSYRVPVLMIQPGGKGQGERCSTLGCSLDIAPTILGRLGSDYRSVFFGYDVLQADPKHGRAIMQHNHDVALLNSDNQMVVLGFGKSAEEFELNRANHQLDQQATPDQEMVHNAIALFQSAFELYYSDRWFPDLKVTGSQKDDRAYTLETSSNFDPE
ncbi:Lipoteichoic acid synthase 1 [Gimesia panareensis]|uniref:Lipoteichoic acid synthase 1 n=1 Tax=Gimesia panareensis TaxID=2527978 RepID=A0A517QBK0_9PLAN|nr:LTA synthase family protein [Gimesia panareensis]QDT29012.1 Lipoteichoic acid synthase 1 [Gimesia panareensis]